MIYEGIIWDLGGVIVDVEVDRSRAAFNKITGRQGKDLDLVMFDSEIKYRLDRGLLSVDSALIEFNQACERNLTEKQFREIWNSMILFRPAVLELFVQYSRNLKVGVLSDTDPIHGQHIASHPTLMETVESWTFSYTAQATKPMEEIYLSALDSMGTSAESTLFIDDRIMNVRGAQSVGIHGILYEDPSLLIQQLNDLGL